MATYYSDMDGKTCIYRAYIDGALAYVGITRNPSGRFSKHSSQKPWWRSVDEIEIHWFETRDEAFAAEKVAIADEDPLYNVSRPRVGAR